MKTNIFPDSVMILDGKVRITRKWGKNSCIIKHTKRGSNVLPKWVTVA